MRSKMRTDDAVVEKNDFYLFIYRFLSAYLFEAIWKRKKMNEQHKIIARIEMIYFDVKHTAGTCFTSQKLILWNNTNTPIRVIEI